MNTLIIRYKRSILMLNFYIVSVFAVLYLYSCEENVEYDCPRLTAQIITPSKNFTSGLSDLTFDGRICGKLYIPQLYSSDKKTPLIVALHGAGGNSSFWKSYYSYAEERGFIFMALNSTKRTWDAIINSYGEDLQTLDRSLKYVFNRCYIDEKHVALLGFSDGGTYTLSVGPCNGDLFTHLFAHSPGYLIYSEPIIGKPMIYISHGRDDTVLSVGCSRDFIVPYFTDNGYDVTYFEFRGGHTVHASASQNSLDWFLTDYSAN